MVPLLLAGVALLGCSPRRVRWRPREGALGTTAPAMSTFAAVFAGTSFRVAPSPSATEVALLPPNDPYEPWARDSFLAFRLIGDTGGWATLETLGEPAAAHCGLDPPSLRAFRLRLHVPSNQLATVTVREVEQSFPDGTSIALARGVPLEPVPGPQRLFRAHTGGLNTVLRLDVADVGTRYLPSSHAEPGTPDGMLAADALHAGVPIVGQTGRLHANALAGADDGAPTYTYDTQARGASESAVTLHPRCAVLRVRVPSHTLLPPPLVGEELPSARPGAVRVERGTRISWPDGREAGVVTEPVEVADEVDADEVETDTNADRRCFGVRFHPDVAPTVLCFSRREVLDPDAGIGAALTNPATASE